MSQKLPINKHPSVIRFRSAIARLISPSLSSLYQVFVDMKRDIEDERSEISAEMDALRLEGYEAAANLVLPEDGFGGKSQGGYFERIHNKRGNNDV